MCSRVSFAQSNFLDVFLRSIENIPTFSHLKCTKVRIWSHSRVPSARVARYFRPQFGIPHTKIWKNHSGSKKSPVPTVANLKSCVFHGKFARKIEVHIFISILKLSSRADLIGAVDNYCTRYRFFLPDSLFHGIPILTTKCVRRTYGRQKSEEP